MINNFNKIIMKLQMKELIFVNFINLLEGELSLGKGNPRAPPIQMPVKNQTQYGDTMYSKINSNITQKIL